MNLRTSSMITTGNAKRMTSIHSLKESGTIEKTSAKNGTYRMTKCKPNETAIAQSNHGFDQGGI